MGAVAEGRAASTAQRADHRRSALKCFIRVYRRNCSVFAATLGFFVFLEVCLLFLPDPFSLEPFTSEESRPVTLLIWTHPFGRYRELPDCSELYNIDGCTLTDDKLTYYEADAVIVHHREVATGAALLPPDPRPSAQKWIWMNYESPTHSPRLWLFDGVFNLTLSYRTDSDIFLPYGYLVPRAHTPDSPVHNRYARPIHTPSRAHLSRPRLVAWVISNWSVSHARVAFYYRLRRYVQVDVFGRAGRPVPRDGRDGSVVRLVRRYQFYLSLENSQHTDYITEKLWTAVQAGAIPVVLGPSRKNYERVLPPEAFIHVDDFPSVRELARYLLMLWRNPTQLRRHLDWRGKYSVRQPVFWAEHYCTACRAVRRSRHRTDVVGNLARWFRS